MDGWMHVFEKSAKIDSNLKKLADFLKQKNGDQSAKVIEKLTKHRGDFLEMIKTSNVIPQSFASNNQNILEQMDSNQIQNIVNRSDKILKAICHLSLPDSYKNIMNTYLKSVLCFEFKLYEQAFDYCNESIMKYVNDIFKPEGYWTIPIMRVFTFFLRVFAEYAEKQGSKNKINEFEDDMDASGTGGGGLSSEEGNLPLSKAVQTIRSIFQTCISDRSAMDISKKWLILFLSTQMFRIYFRLNKLGLCTNLIRTIEQQSSMPPLEDFPLAQRVTYSYYAGRIHMFGDEFDKAQQNFEFAFKHCHKNYKKNKKLILQYLVCVRLMLGKLPKQNLLIKYGMENFIDITHALRRGDLKTFQNALDKHQQFFIQQGTYFLITKARIVVFRNLFRTILLIVKGTKIKFKIFQVIFKYLGCDMDSDEIECILCNLIYQGYIRGYISHQQQTLVVDKETPFPKIRNQHLKK